MTVEDSHLLVKEKSADMKNSEFRQESTDEGNCTETQEYYNQRFWTWVAFVLLTLTFISGAIPFCGGGAIRRYGQYVPSSHRAPLKIVDMKPLARPRAYPIETDISKSMYFNINGFADLRSNQSRIPRKLYKSVGQTVLHDGKAYLTSQITTDENGVIPMAHSVGRLMHPRPFRVKHRGPQCGEQIVVSFHTSFVFSIKNLLKDREATGDGFAFLMVPQDNVLGSGGGYLGVMNTTNVANTFAVEFDIWRNPTLQDTSNNHVGINVNSMVSVAASEAGYWSQGDTAERFNRVDLIGGKIQAWIDYDGLTKELTVSISPELGTKPQKPLLSKHLDLTKVFRKYMYAGFSAATGEFSAKHIIHSWKFEKHVNPPRSGAGFRAPKFPNPSAESFQPHRFPAVGFPHAFRGCPDLFQKLSSAFHSSVRDLSTGFSSHAEEKSQLWLFTLVALLVGLALMQLGLCVYQTCVASCFGPVECYESTRELQELAEARRQRGYILVLSEPQLQEHPRVCSAV